MPDSNVDQYFREITIVKDTWTRVDTEFDTSTELGIQAMSNILPQIIKNRTVSSFRLALN